MRDGIVRTPPLMSCLAGITRESVIKILADAGIPVIEQRFPRDMVYIADEAFMTGTAAEVTPVRELDDRQIGEGKPGPITRKVIEVFRRRIARPRIALRHVAVLRLAARGLRTADS